MKLPKYVHKKGPSYYRVRGNIWTRLGRDLDDALERNRIIEETGCESFGRSAVGQFKFEDIDAHYRKLYGACRTNARTRKVEFLLTRTDMQAMINRCNYRCEVSGVPFTLEQVGHTRKRPFAPSIDRIDAGKPYTAENCRLVLWAVNAGMQDWGMVTYLAIAEQALKFQECLETAIEFKDRRRIMIGNVRRLKS